MQKTVWKSFCFRADSQKQTLSRVAICIGLWAVRILPSHTPGTEMWALSDPRGFSHLSAMDVAAAVSVGRSGQQQDWTRIPGMHLERCMHAYTHIHSPPACLDTKTNTDRKQCCPGTPKHLQLSHIWTQTASAVVFSANQVWSSLVKTYMHTEDWNSPVESTLQLLQLPACLTYKLPVICVPFSSCWHLGTYTQRTDSEIAQEIKNII